MSNLAENVVHTSASPEEVFEVINAIEPTLVGFKKTTVVIACLAIAVSTMKPEVEADELREVVENTSQYIALALTGKIEPEMMN